MTVLFLIALVLLVWDRRHAHSTQESLLIHCQQMLDQQTLRHSKAEKRWMDERTLLLNRIKPETRQPILDEEPVHTPPAVHPDLDSDYWVNKDELAELMAREEMNA
jgi:hypothetical protein